MSTQSHIDKVNLTPNLMEYPHHVGAPQIVPTDLTPFKRNGTDKVNKIFNRRYQELIKEAETLQKSFIVNQEVYDSSYKFEPIIGEIYHLYEGYNGRNTLSLIGPKEWNQKHIYSAVLNSDMTWTKLPE
jgi:hypothetical protein